MSAELRNSEMRAFAGESQARNRYTFAATLCGEQNLYVLEAMFRFTADQEREHAEIFYNHMKTLSGETVHIDGGYPIDLSNNVSDLLRAAQHNEWEEFDSVYPAFADVAQKEGFYEVAASFHGIAFIERSHGQRFEHFADLVESGKLFVSDVKCGWLCLNCGHINQSLQAPKTCPVCGHNQGYFIRMEMLGGES